MMNKKRILILEDNEERNKQFHSNFSNAEIVITDNVEVAKKKLIEEKWDALFLDHDLGGKVYVESGGSEPTGYDVAKFLSINTQFKPECIILHSLNESGRKNMLALVPEAREIPFVWTMPMDF